MRAQLGGAGADVVGRVRATRVACAAGDWGLLQGLEYVTDTFGRSGHIQQLATLALQIGRRPLQSD